MRFVVWRLALALLGVLWTLAGPRQAMSQEAGIPASAALSRQLYDVIRREPDFPSGTQYIFSRYATRLPSLAEIAPKDTTPLARVLALEPAFGTIVAPIDISAMLPGLEDRLIDTIPAADDRSAWSMLRERFSPDVHIVELSQVSTDSEQTRAIVVVDVLCGERCGNRSTIYRLAMAGGKWSIVSRSKVME